MKDINYRAFSANMLMILETEYPDITLKEKENEYTLYFTQCGKQTINLSSFYNDYLNGTNLREISGKINTILKKER